MTNQEIREALVTGRKMRPVYSPQSVFITHAEHVVNGLWRIELNGGGNQWLNAASNIVGDPLPRPPQDATRRFVRALSPR